MATKRQLKSGKWNVQVRVKGHRPLSSTFATENEADIWAAKTEDYLKADKTSFPSWREMGLLYCSLVLAGKPSRHLKIGRVNLIGRFPSMDKPYNEISVSDVDAFKQGRLAEGKSPTTVHDDLVFIRRVYRWIDSEARSKGHDPVVNPAEWVAIPKPNPPRSKVITPKELEILLDALSPRMRPIVELAYETAMRRSEICRLHLKDIHLPERILDVVDCKEGNRTVPLTKRACQLLGDALKGLKHPSARLFPFAPHSVTQAVRRARKRVGLDDDVRLHQLRHTRCTIVAKRGFNPAQIMVVTGHKDVRSVQRYTHLNARDILKILE